MKAQMCDNGRYIPVEGGGGDASRWRPGGRARGYGGHVRGQLLVPEHSSVRQALKSLRSVIIENHCLEKIVFSSKRGSTCVGLGKCGSS
jgi:hypothetical protein